MHSWLRVFLLLATSSAHTVAVSPCLCSSLRPPAGLLVNCSAMDLTEIPQLPSNTTQLHLQGNLLTAVSPGAFDTLLDLREVSLSGNLFHCDCRIRYLRNWLLRNTAVSVTGGGPTCASPSPVAHKDIVDLGEELFGCCAAEQGCADVVTDGLLGAMLLCLVVLLLWCMRLAKNAAFTLHIGKKHVGFEAYSLRSKKPKHRQRLQSGGSYVSGDSGAPSGHMMMKHHVAMQLYYHKYWMSSTRNTL
ncbi:hypothetical protein NHX12_012601 [Muraenolepis orangiensis]|uniref:LRRCT domain-containing protein n=1 Tax=Muraenolepis orangiensis TaxID=630683 RepID=A0A9Q0DEG6_9TELE|nr:hypothetical protein NHX12_012601 [Muraenolepis orangiensis]